MDGLCTGTLIHPELILYAGHCGTDIDTIWFGNRFHVDLQGDQPVVTPEGDYQSLHPAHCEAHPDALLGVGADLAYCLLPEPVIGVPPIRPIAGCEREAIAVGTKTTLVGFGFEEFGGVMPGIKRSVEAQVSGYYFEFTIGDDGAGTCRGDSGGPALVDVSDDPSGARSDWRLLGVLSTGEQGRCGLGYYTDVARFLPWLELSSERDLTPCGDAMGTWRPTRDCLRLDVDDEGFIGASDMPTDRCGPPFEESENDTKGGTGSCSLGPIRPPPFAGGILLTCLLVRRRRRRSEISQPSTAENRRAP